MQSLLIAIIILSNPPTQDSVRIASYNLQNYLVTSRRVEGRWVADYPKPESEKQALRDIIHEVRPDILAIQEIGGLAFLTELQDDLRVEGLDYPYAYLLEGPDDKRHLAMLSRIEPLAVHKYPEIAFRYLDTKENVRRGLLGATFRNGETTWTLYNIHLKSRWPTRKDDPHSQTWRTSEAQAIRNLIRQQHSSANPEACVLIAGDVNDQSDSPAIQRFLRVGQTRLTKLVPTHDSRSESWTFRFRRRDSYERVDFFLASPPLMPFIVPDSGKIADTLPQSLTASDHRMIYLDLDFSRPGHIHQDSNAN